jgi:hypothetical protein
MTGMTGLLRLASMSVSDLQVIAIIVAARLDKRVRRVRPAAIRCTKAAWSISSESSERRAPVENQGHQLALDVAQ